MQFLAATAIPLPATRRQRGALDQVPRAQILPESSALHIDVQTFSLP
jgi:hypothetical protein